MLARNSLIRPRRMDPNLLARASGKLYRCFCVAKAQFGSQYWPSREWIPAGLQEGLCHATKASLAEVFSQSRAPAACASTLNISIRIKYTCSSVITSWKRLLPCHYSYTPSLLPMINLASLRQTSLLFIFEHAARGNRNEYKQEYTEKFQKAHYPKYLFQIHQSKFPLPKSNRWLTIVL